ncbi:hypothetical protein ABW19_dt0200696 [Dactylella cylindrospora]|nr:hypothetical protein ABW19_dt0200696 [Dactylella cylindrospora]
MVASNQGSIPFSGLQGTQAVEGRFNNPLSLTALATSSWSPTINSSLGRRLMGRAEEQNPTRSIPKSSSGISPSPLLTSSDKYSRPTPQIIPRSTAVSTTLSEAQMPLSMAQPPRSTPRQADYNYYSADDTTQQYTASSVQNQGMAYPSDYSAQDAMQRQGSYSSYPQNMVYNMPQSASSDPYEQSAYPPRQQAAAAIEVLSNQFGVSPYYPDGSPHAAANVSPQQAQAQYPNISYAGRAASQTYGAQIPIGPEENQQFMYPNPEEANPDQAMDAAYNQYQDALRSCYQNIRDGRMAAAGSALLEISEWLLSNAVDLVAGLVRDEQELYKDRSRLWNEFNMCWLLAMQKQKELLLEQKSTGQSIQPPRDLIPEEDLEKMGGELLRHCDNMEKHGLVDYQMGVWEEEILDAIQECIDLLQNKEAAAAPESSR